MKTTLACFAFLAFCTGLGSLAAQLPALLPQGPENCAATTECLFGSASCRIRCPNLLSPICDPGDCVDGFPIGPHCECSG